MVLYYFVPSEPFKLAMTLLASVAAAAIILPELSSDLWSMDPDRIRALIPGSQRESLAKALIDAEFPDEPEWANLIWYQSLQPLMVVSEAPWLRIWDMDYDIDVRLDKAAGTTDLSDLHPVTSVSVDSKSTRILPPLSKVPGGRYWLSMARTEASVKHEYDQLGCLGRELTPMSEVASEAWYEIVRSRCSASLLLEGELIELTPEPVEELPDIVRWYAPSSFVPPSEHVRVRLMFDFIMEATRRSFEVSFRSYYCAGSTAITMKMYGCPDPLECQEFFARALTDNTGHGISLTKHDSFEQAVFSTGRNSIVWPESGVLFRW
jgi:hypothetical protein